MVLRVKWSRWQIAKIVWEVLVTVAVVSLFAWQVGLNVKAFLARPTVFLVHYEPVSTFRLPPVTICPHPVFESSHLRRLGVNVSTNYIQVKERLSSLEGLDDNLKASTLWQDAQWRLGQVVQNMIVDKVLVNYKHDATEHPDWYRSYSPLGPCFTYLPPVGKTDVNIALHKIPKVELCSWINGRNQSVMYNGVSSQCDEVEEKCNSTCGFENYVFYRRTKFDAAFVYFHTATVYDALKQISHKNIFEFSDQLFGGHYVLKRLSYAPNLRSQSQLIETSLVKDCVTSSSSKCHLLQQTTKALQKLGCLPVQDSTFEEPISKTCSSPNLIQDLYGLEKDLESCPKKCFTRHWEHTISNSWGPDFIIVLEAASTDLRRETELETYPLAQLFSNIGGSLGLFLGVSLLHVWNLCFRVMLSDKKEEIRNTGRVIKYVGILCMCFAMCVHCLQELKTFISQPILTSVYLRTSSGSSDDLVTALARRLAVRALDCRPVETPLTECQVQCLLENVAKEVMSTIPFIDIEDLAFCSYVGLLTPSYDYIVPPEALLVASSLDIVESCTESCLKKEFDFNITSDHLNYMYVDSNYRSYDVLRLVCSLAGIIGLYLGISIFQGIDYCHDRLRSTRNDSKSFPIHMKRFLKMLVLASGLIFLLLQCQGFIFRHQVSLSVSQTQAVPQVVTVCRWPPLSFPHVASYLGINITKDDVLEMPLEQRQEVVLQLLDSLEGNWEGSLEDLWSAGGWNLSDVIDAYSIHLESGLYYDFICDSDEQCEAMWKPVMTPLNRCFAMNTTLGNETFAEILIHFTDESEKYIHKGTPRIYFLLHPLGVPPLLTNMIAKGPATRDTVSVFSATYNPLKTSQQLESTSYELCVQRCLADGFGDVFECRLPYMESLSDLPLCNQSQYAGIPRHFKGLEDVGESLSAAERGVRAPLLNLEVECFVSCHSLRRTFYTLQTERVPSLYPSLTVRPQVETMHTWETDMYTFAQLVSDLGGIAGVFVGFSLLLFKKGASSASTD